jgi:hypothetical protein
VAFSTLATAAFTPSWASEITKLTAEIEQAAVLRCRPQTGDLVSQAAPARQEHWRELFQLLPESRLRRFGNRQRRGDCRRNAELRRIAIGGDGRVPPERPGETGIGRRQRGDDEARVVGSAKLTCRKSRHAMIHT